MLKDGCRFAASNKRLERTRHERASLLSNLGEPLKRNVGFLLMTSKSIHLLLSGVSAFLLLNAANAYPQNEHDDGRFVKPEGWNIASLQRLKTKSQSQLRVASSNVNVKALLVPDDGILFEDTAYCLDIHGSRTLHPSPMNARGAARYDVNGRVFCYTVFGPGVAIAQISKTERRVGALGCESRFAFYDQDGDGKFETLVPLPYETPFEPKVPLWVQR